MSDFKREDRYTVIKHTDIGRIPHKAQLSARRNLRSIHEELFKAGAPARSFVVVESDWPEYNFVWLMLEHRMAGYPVPDFNAVKCAADVAVAQSQLAASLATNESLSAELAWSENDSRDQSKEIAALREELTKADPAGSFDKHMQYMQENIELKQRLADAERRNSELVDLLKSMSPWLEQIMARSQYDLEFMPAFRAVLTKPEEAK